MGKPKLTLHAPVNHIITSVEGASDSFLFGHLLTNNVPSECDIQITLARFGRLKQDEEATNAAALKGLFGGLAFWKSQQEQKRERFNYESVEKLSGCLVSPSRTPAGAKTNKCEFELLVPPYLPATAALPSLEILYAIFATCHLPNGKVLQASQDLRIIRKSSEPTRLEPSRTVSFPETSFAVRAYFNAPKLGSKDITIPTTLHLHGLNLPSTHSTRPNETRWLVPREIKWELEETAVLVTGSPDETGHLPMSTAQRIFKKRKLATGEHKLKLKYPFTRRENSFIRMLENDAGLEIPFNVNAPQNISLGDGTAMCVAGGHIVHTVRSSDTPADAGLSQGRFAAHLEYWLHVWLRIGEDVFDEASGDLVNRKMDEMAYTVVCPLTAQQAMQELDGLPSVAPPGYDGVWERPPPVYAASS